MAKVFLFFLCTSFSHISRMCLVFFGSSSETRRWQPVSHPMPYSGLVLLAYRIRYSDHIALILVGFSLLYIPLGAVLVALLFLDSSAFRFLIPDAVVAIHISCASITRAAFRDHTGLTISCFSRTQSSKLESTKKAFGSKTGSLGYLKAKL